MIKFVFHLLNYLYEMKRIIYLLTIFVYFTAFSQENEINTNELSLQAIYTQKYFFNVISHEDQVYVGTDQGIFKVKNGELELFIKKNGYVLFNTETKKFTTTDYKDGLLNQRLFDYVIPNGKKKEGHSANEGDNLFIVYNGQLYHYKKKNMLYCSKVKA